MQSIISKPKGRAILKAEQEALQKKYFHGFSYCFLDSFGDNPSGKTVYQSNFRKLNELTPKDHEGMFSDKTDSVIICNDNYNESRDSGLYYCESEDKEDWYLFSAAGTLSWVSVPIASNKSKVVFDKFVRHMSKKSRHSWLRQIADDYSQDSYVLIEGGFKNSLKLFGVNFVKINGIYYSNADHLFDLSHEQKNFIRRVLLYFSKKNEPSEIKAEINRLESLTNVKLREEASKVENLLPMVESM